MNKKYRLMSMIWLVVLLMLIPQLNTKAQEITNQTVTDVATNVSNVLSSQMNKNLVTENGQTTKVVENPRAEVFISTNSDEKQGEDGSVVQTTASQLEQGDVTNETVSSELHPGLIDSHSTTVETQQVIEPEEITSQVSTVVETSQVSTEISEIRVIVETNNISALNRAAYRDQDAFEKAKLEAEAEVEATFEQIRNMLAQEGLMIEKEKTFSATFTGFSAKVSQPILDRLSLFKEVLTVTTQMAFTIPKADKQMHSSVDMVGLNKMLNEGLLYKGEGMLVSVIDTGADPDHRDLVLGDNIPLKYTEEQMKALVKELGLPGKWYSNKIVYGYNYADETETIKDRDEHGLHVAGTIGANGDPSQGGLIGVAPHVQLLIMKAFSNNLNDSSVYEDVWLKAIDDSIKLGADVINMSLGMPAGFSINGDTPTAKAFRLARLKGILPVVAAGNDHNTTWGTGVNNLETNPDASVLGYPAVVEESAAVASFENMQQARRYLQVKYGDKDTLVNFIGSDTYPEGFTPDFHNLVAIGRGLLEDYVTLGLDKADLTGKYVLVERGGASFNEKYHNALSRNAAGVIIYDNSPADQPMNMIGLENLTAPIMFITQNSGHQLLDLLKSNQDLKVRVPQGIEFFVNPLAGKLSEFSSWGPTTDLRLKPDLAAPGGNIYSLMSDNRYQNMSGTSMATPHIAGLAALVMQRLYQDGLLSSETSVRDITQDDLALLMLMNTAKPVMNGDSYYSPIQQGAGLVNIYNAIKNFVTVTATNSADQNADGKLEIKEVGDQFDATLMITNHGTQTATYQLEYVLLKDQVGSDKRYTGLTTIQQRNQMGTITVEPGQSISLSKVLSTLGIDQNQYVQGYILLNATSDTPSLSVPFFGYKGKWDKAPIFDEMLDFSDENHINYIPVVHRNDDGEITFIEKGGFVQPGKQGGWNFWNAWKVAGENTIFVNNGDNGDYHSSVAPVLSPLRDSVNLKFQIVDEKDQVVRQLFLVDRLFKTNGLYKENGRFNYLRLMDFAAWDFKDGFREFVDEGVYYYKITGQIDAPNASEQVYKYRLVYDNTPSDLIAERTNNQLSIVVKDNLAGINVVTLYNPVTNAYKEIFVDKSISPQLLEETFLVDLAEEGFNQGEIVVTVYDNAGNSQEQIIKISDVDLPEAPEETESPAEEENPEQPVHVEEEEVVQSDVDPKLYPKEEGLTTAELPMIEMEVPFNYQMFSNQNIPLNALISHFDEVHQVVYRVKDSQGNEVLAPKQAKLIKLTKEGVSELRIADEIDIAKLEASDQYLVEITFYGKSVAGNLVANTVANRFRVDKVAPKLQVKQVDGPDKDLLYFEIEYDENMNYVEIWANNNLLAREDKTYDSLKPIRIQNKLVYTIAKSEIGKEVIFAAYDDAAGNESIVKILLAEKEKDVIVIDAPKEDEGNTEITPNEDLAKIIKEIKDKLSQPDQYRWPAEWSQDTVAKLIEAIELGQLDSSSLAQLETDLIAANNRIVRFSGGHIQKGQHFGVAKQNVQTSQVLPKTGEQKNTLLTLIMIVSLIIGLSLTLLKLKSDNLY